MADEKKETPRSAAKRNFFSSTVFACDLSSDTRYIRCDFPQCSEHGTSTQAKPSWILNTLKNVRTLESHVGKEVHSFMKAHTPHCIFSDTQHKIESQQVIESCRLPIGTKKVLAVFNLKDCQSQLGEWLDLFLKAAFLAEYGDKRRDFLVLTQDFVSRYELMECIARLEFLKSNSPKVEVVCVLSSHSSCQGQVFSCTPTGISKEHGFEEFCSLHDVTLACQDVLGDKLEGFHISSCFTLKLDCSHVDWPVDASWFKNKLKCVLTGSTREVYETGSQICDLHLVLTTMLSPPIASFSVNSCGERLRNAVFRAQTEEFPDLAREMGLEVVNGQIVSSKLQRQGIDDKVSLPSLVVSEVFVALLVEQDASLSISDSPSISKTLAEALSANLSTRKASDIRCNFMVLPIIIDKVSSLKTKSSLKEKLNELPRKNSKVFFVVLSPSLANPSTGLIEAIRGWSVSRGGNNIYGVHFQEVSALQAFYIKTRLKEEVALCKYSKNVDPGEENDVGNCGLEHISVTGLVDNSDKNPHVALPVLMYLVHLAIGENGERLAGKGIPSGVYSKKPVVGPGTSCWTLEEVYMETCHVLSGLARKCSLQVLSLPVAETTNTTPVKPTIAIHEDVSIPVCTTDEKGVILHERIPTSPLKTDTMKDCPLSTQRTRKRAQQNAGSILSSSIKGAGKSADRELIQLTPKQERMKSDEMIITRVVQTEFEKEGETTSPCSRKRSRECGNVEESDESPAKRLANSIAEQKRSSRPFSSPSSPGVLGKITESTSDIARDVPTCFKNLTNSFEKESMPSSLPSLNKPEASCLSLTCLSERSDIDSYTANMRSTNKCSGVGKPLPKPVKASPRRDMKHCDERSLDVHVSTDLCSKGVICASQCRKSRLPSKSDDVNNTPNVGEKGGRICGVGAQTDPISMDVDSSISYNEPVNHTVTASATVSASIDKSNGSICISDEDNNKMHTELLESQKDPTIANADDNFKGTQADFSSFSEKRNHNKTQGILEKIKRLKTKTISSPVSNNQEKPDKAKQLFSSIECNSKLTQIKSNLDKDPSVGANVNPVSQPDAQKSTEKYDILEEGQTEESQNIPLMANVDEVQVKHYVLDLTVDFEQQVMRGSIVLFLEPANEEVTSNTFQLCLDSTLVNVESVSEVFLPEDFKIPFFWRKSSGSVIKNGSSNTAVNIKDGCFYSCGQRTGGNTDSSYSNELQSCSEGTELSLFQRLQKSYGIGSEQNNRNSSQANSENPRKNSKYTEINPEYSRVNPGPSRINSESLKDQTGLSEEVDSSTSSPDDTKPDFTLPGFLKLLAAKSCDPLPYKGLTYSVYGWCIRIWKEGATEKTWPKCVCIKYQTSPNGQSLMWTTDQDGKPCVFSPGAYINNRSLMPCQEPPVAMSTWQAAIHVPQGCMAYMSGCPVTIEKNSEKETHYFEMDIPLPCSTLALAVGWLPCREGPTASVLTQEGSTREIPCRIVAAPSLIDKAADQLLHHSHTYVEAACELLGPYPFDRLDLLILPRCFACMGLKSPNLAFLSQSILASDSSLRLRVAHEVSHAWFGLLIGAKDWTEEWLSEGFATYMEDSIQSKGEKWLEHQDQQYREIRQLLRYRTLSSEMRETERSMQCLRPKITKFNVVEMAEEADSNNSDNQAKPSTVIKYKCSKKWTQVHYLKGYFLLNHLANMVGRETFGRFLYDYVQHYQGLLVNSEDFFEFFVLKFPEMLTQTVESIKEEWLERPGIPKCLRRKSFASKENVLVNRALEEDTSEQIVLMLEKLLERDGLLHTTLRQLNKSYQFDTLNAEIRHRWCELVVKHKFTPALKDVSHFLIEDQGMGIYLFGELIISGQAKQRQMAEQIFAEIGDEMDRCTYKTVSDMLEGVE